MHAWVVSDFRYIGSNTWEAQHVSTSSKALICLSSGSGFESACRATLWNFGISFHSSTIVLYQTQESDIWTHPAWKPAHCLAVRETCTGAGALGWGLSRVGFVTCARNELQPATAEVLRCQGSVPIQGDICDLQVAKALGEANARPAGLCAGVSCQPFSLLKDRKHGEDPRSSSLTGTLRAAFLMHSSFVLLECVTPAADSKFVQDQIGLFQEVSGFCKVETCLDILDVWPARRNRWWCLLLPQMA